MEYIDLQNLLEYLLSISSEYREILNLDDSLVFGLDTEYKFNNAKEIEKMVKEINNTYFPYNDKYKVMYNHVLFNFLKQENSISIDTPVFSDSNIFYESLKELLVKLEKSNVELSDNKGLHIHVDLSYFEEDTNTLINFLKVFAIYENILFRFGYGDSDFCSNNSNLISKPSSNIIYDYLINKNKSLDFYKSIEELKRILICKGYSINFHDKDKNVKNETIELRFFNNTFNPVIIQNYISLVGNLFSSVKNNNVDLELLDYKFDNYNRNLYNLENYSTLDSINAIEFADNIFSNSQDEEYFLKQYFIKEKVKIKQLVS